MLDELLISSSLLCAAIDRYSSICLAIQRSFARGEKPHITTPQLSVQIDAEVRQVASLEAKLQKAKAAINWSRNHSNTHTTINDLPRELLTYIFQLVRTTEPCARRDYNSYKKIEPMYPSVLSYVCSRWRETVFSTPALWTHLDISTSELLNRQRLDGLARLHSTRAGHLPLDFHVFDSPGYDSSYRFLGPTHQLIGRLARCAASFNLDAGDFDHHVHHEILSIFLEKCSPGKLTRLTLTQRGDGPEFIRGCPESDDEDSDDLPGWGLDVLGGQLEEVLFHVSILRLEKLFPLWNSLAYHGLVELRLTGSETVILESELIGILRSSPDLRILQFNLDVHDPRPLNDYITSVPLNNLEVLNLTEMRNQQLKVLLRWLAPGQKPLQFGFTSSSGDLESQFEEESSGLFFARSLIAKAYVKYMKLSHILELLNLSPNLRMLAVRGIKYKELVPTTSLISERQLECLHMICCSVHIDLILALTNNPLLKIKTFSFYDCSFYLGGEKILGSQVVSHVKQLCLIFPGAKFVVQNHNVDVWDLFASCQMIGPNEVPL